MWRQVHRWWESPFLKTFVSVGLAFLTVGLFTLAQYTFLGVVGSSLIYVTYDPAVIVLTLFFGPVGGLSTVVFAAVAADLFLIQPIGNLVIHSESDFIGWVVFVISSLLICVLTTVASRSAKRAAQLQEDNKTLQIEAQVKDRFEALSKRLDLAVQAGKFGVWDWDMERDSLVWDDRMYALYGITKESFSHNYQAWLDRIHPDDRAELESSSRTRTQTRQANYEFEFRVLWPDGSSHYLRSHAAFERSPAGKPVRMIGFNEDVTEQKTAEAALRESEFFFKESQAAASIGSYKTDFVQGCWQSSDVLDSIFGIDRSYVRSIEGWLDLVHPDDRPMMDQYLREEVLLKRQPFAKEYRIVRKSNGATRWVFGLGRVSVDGQGNVVSLIGTIQDITERKQSEEERDKLQLQLFQSQKMENLGLLAGGIAHDMNNALAVILTQASMKMLTLSEDDPLYHSFASIAKAAERGGKMTRNLLGFARQGQIEEQETDLNTVVREVVELLDRTTQPEISMEMDLSSDLKAVNGDASALTHALMNLCVNALDAMADGGTLTLRTRNEGPHLVEVQVHDTGSGMTKEVLARAVDPFFTTKPVGKGTGLGLSMVYRSIQSHHGNLYIDSSPGAGTMVTIQLPEFHRAPPETSKAAVKPGLLPALTVLLVDDDELILGSIRDTLVILGHEVAGAPSGEKALELLDGGLSPHVVILDLNMPGLGGKATLVQLRSRFPTLPVILATGRSDQAALELVNAFPMVRLLSKPFTVNELRNQLEQL